MRVSTVGTSPKSYARLAGLAYLVIVVVGGFAYSYLPSRWAWEQLIANIDHPPPQDSVWRWVIVSQLAVAACALLMSRGLYLLLKPVHRMLALLAMTLNLLSLVVASAVRIRVFRDFLSLGPKYQVLIAPQRHAPVPTTSLVIVPHLYAEGLSILLFGGFCLALGYLVFRAGFFPKILGVFVALAGVLYSCDGLMSIFGVAGVTYFSFIARLLTPALELSFYFWLLVMGVNAAKWQERAEVSEIRR